MIEGEVGNKRHGQVILRVSASYGVDLLRLTQLPKAVLAHGLEHPEPISGTTELALVDQGRQGVEINTGDGCGGSERAAACEQGHRAERLLLVGVEQVVRPGDRRLERSLPLGEIPSPMSQQR